LAGDPFAVTLQTSTALVRQAGTQHPVRTDASTGPVAAAETAHPAVPAFETVVRTGLQSKAQVPASALPPAVTLTGKAKKTHADFEAFTLQTMISSMLPDETVKLFGTGSSGGFWKGFLAEKLAGEIARGGRLRLVPEAAFAAAARIEPGRAAGQATGGGAATAPAAATAQAPDAATGTWASAVAPAATDVAEAAEAERRDDRIGNTEATQR